MLSKREQIITMIKDGKKPKDIIKTLKVSPQYVYTTAYLAKKKRIAKARKNVYKVGSPEHKKRIAQRSKEKSVDNYRWISAEKVDPQIGRAHV